MGTGPIAKNPSKTMPWWPWGIEKEFYNNSKYWGTVWSFNLLAQLGADGSDTRVRSAAEFLLKCSQHDSGGFSNGKCKGRNGRKCPTLPDGQSGLVDAPLRHEGR